MAQLEVMISSRNTALVPAGKDRKPVTMTIIRQRAKDRLIGSVFGKANPIFGVWINEDDAAVPNPEDTWEACIRRAIECDLFIAIFDGHAGWRAKAETIGICEAEMNAALQANPSKVLIVTLEPVHPRGGKEGEWDKRYVAFVKGLRRSWATVKTAEALENAMVTAARNAIVELTSKALAFGRSGTPYLGIALGWTRMNFEARKEAMEEEVTAGLKAAGGRPVEATKGERSREIVAPLGGGQVLLYCSAMPAAFSVGAAREMLGQPFLNDYQILRQGDNVAGPVHVIACYRGITEALARGYLGFPDAIFVQAPFGMWVADRVGMAQTLFLARCSDPNTTRLRLEQALRWLAESREGDELLRRAESRARIVRAIAAEVKSSVGDRHTRGVH
jgi:hypothetical protein